MFQGMPSIPQLMSMIMSGNNPKNMVVNSLKREKNAGLNNLADMIQNNDVSGVEQLARNAAKERGLNIDEMKSNLERQLSRFR